MTPENFCYWLQGFIEIEKPVKLEESQLQEIRNHLNLVFNKLTPIVVDSSKFPYRFNEQTDSGNINYIPNLRAIITC